MLFWVIAAVMTALATLALVAPVWRSRMVSPDAEASHDVEVYRDQLSEIDRDLADGLVEPAQAEVARTEISRRLLAAARKGEAEAARGGRADNLGLRRAMAVLVLVFMPIAAITAYLQLGRPDLPQLPLSARLQADTENSDIAILITRAERHLAENPNDGRGWDVLGPIYLKTGRYEDAVSAFQKAISILGPSPARQSNLGEALFSAAGGLVTEEARIAFQTARELDSTDARARFFLAVGLAQSGKTEEARTAFSSMLETAPEGAPWIPAVQSQLAALAPDQGGLTGLDSVPRNPTAADIAAADNMSPEERQAMIASMIESLETRLNSSPDNITGWLRLVRAHTVMGARDKAQAALERAFTTFPPASEEGQALAALANDLGLAAAPTLGGVPVTPAEPETPAVPPSPAAQAPFILPDANPDAAPADNAASVPGGPSQADIAAAQSMSAEDRMAMIRNMVASLDQRLTENPDNLEGWLRLVQSYAVLGDRPAAQDALNRASGAFAAGSEGGRALAGLAQELGLEPGLEGQ